MLLRVRGETVKFSSFQKTKENIETLEKIENPMAVHTDLLCDKKVELEDLRFLKEINTLIFGYLWAGKPEKISRQNLFKKYQNGGLKMIDVYKFEKSQKMSWLKRIASQNDHAWYKLLTESAKIVCNVTSLGWEWCRSILKKVNPFWTNVL